MEKPLRKSLSLGAGIGTSLIAFYSLFILILIPIFLNKADVQHTENSHFSGLLLAFWFAYLLILPLCVFLGGFVSGLIYQPDGGLTIKHALVWGPGIYVVFTQLIDLFPMPHGLPQIVGAIVAAFFPSWLGMKMGISKRLRGTMGAKPGI